MENLGKWRRPREMENLEKWRRPRETEDQEKRMICGMQDPGKWRTWQNGGPGEMEDLGK